MRKYNITFKKIIKKHVLFNKKTFYLLFVFLNTFLY